MMEDKQWIARTLARIELTSSAFQNGQPIPAQYSCDGTDQAPPLAWGDPPAGTRSSALVVDIPTLRTARSAIGAQYRHPRQRPFGPRERHLTSH